MNASKQLISGKKTNGLRRFLPSFFKARKPRKASGRPVYGLVFFVFVLVGLSVLGGMQLRPQTVLFVAGEIATQDVTADQDLLVEDAVSTHAKRRQVAELQPPVFDLSLTPIEHLQSRVAEVFAMIDSPTSENSDPEQLRWIISESLNSEIAASTVRDWQEPSVRKIVRQDVLPWMEEQLISGVAVDKTLMLQYRHGIVVRDLTTATETIRLELAGVPDIRDLRNNLATYLKDTLKLPLSTRRSITALFTPLMAPTLTLNREVTNLRSRMATESIAPVYNQIKKGEIIVRQGERVTEEDQMQLQALISHKQQTMFPMRIAGLFIVSLMLGGGFAFAKPGRRISDVKNKDLYFTGLLLLLFGVGAKMLLFAHGSFGDASSADMRGELLQLLFPVSGGMGLVAMIFGFKRCSVTALILSFLCTAMTGGGLWLFLYYFIGSMLYVLLVKRAQTRSDIALSIFPHMAGLMATWIGVALFQRFDSGHIWMGCLYVLGNGLLSLLVQFAVSPLIEMVFSYTTRFRLMELMNLEQPMLQELMLEAPGTYHHSLIVANMVEAGAKSIGANSLLCKVAALYHDMGKLSKPEYFIENQGRAKNPHDKIAPSMSTLVISSHVKRGVEMARQHRLGDEIAGIIEQHHGTSLIRYFFNKAKEAGDNPREEDYSYPGPKPQTREAAIVMLADAVEASSRVLADPTPSRIRGHIDTIIKSIFAEGQLDESELTLRDLHTLTESFHRILTGIFHRRIEYPDDKKEKNGTAKKPEEKSEAKQEAKQPQKADEKNEPKETAADQTGKAATSLTGSEKKSSNPLQ